MSPYPVWKFPRELDPPKHLVLTKDRLPLRETADRTGRPLATLDFDGVKLTGPAADGEWVKGGSTAGKAMCRRSSRGVR